MTRKYTDNELLALTRNRREAKALKTRMEKLDEERATFHDISGKEKSKMKNMHKEHRRSSGSSPFLWDDPQVQKQSVDHSLMRRFSKPWSICPAETTHNIVFKEISSVRPLSSLTSPRPKSEPNRKRVSVTPKSAKNGHSGGGVNKEVLVSTTDTSLNQSNYSSIEHVNLDKAEDGVKPTDNLKTMKSNESEIKSSADYTKKDNEDEIRNVSDVCEFSKESHKDSNGNVTDHPLMQMDDVVNRNQINEISQPCLTQSAMKSQTSKKKRKSTSKRPSTAFMSVLPSVSEAHSQEPFAHEDQIKQSDNHDVPTDPVSVETDENRNKMKGEISNSTEGDIITAVEEFSSINLADNIPPTVDQDSPEVNPAISFHNNVNSTADNLIGNDTEKMERGRPLTRIGIERQTSRVSAAISNQHGEPRPSTVAGVEVLDFESLSDAENGDNIIYFKGQKLRNYVSPQRRYKQDPFRFKRREKLFTKLAKDNPDIVDEVRKDSVKVELRLSKSARTRLLEQLVMENGQRETSRRLAQTDKDMDGRIKKFIGSISYLCSETDERSKQMHPLLA